MTQEQNDEILEIGMQIGYAIFELQIVIDNNFSDKNIIKILSKLIGLWFDYQKEEHNDVQ